ncbi:hypothetical protein BJ741DRAFT_674929 [Chytriomyces cf. hyalinus JEL632]|nr:hypothetical protein BJ741DRAFT_674929 [Chytriomyces cf. hyalinus JEL632]
MVNLPIEILLQILLQLDPFKIAKYRRVCRSFNNALTAHSYSNLIGLVHIGQTRERNGIVCFVTPATFGAEFLAKFPINPVTAINRHSVLDNIPDELVDQLETFLLGGPLSSMIGSQEQLKSLDLHIDTLYGPIPRSLSELVNLNTLCLDNNNMAGAIPSELGNLIGSLRDLRDLNVGHNQLCGKIPSGVFVLSELLKLQLNNSKLSGPLHRDFGALEDLGTLDLSYNQLIGTVPESIWELAYCDLHTLNLDHNQLSGHLSTNAGFSPCLFTLNLSHNQLSGPIPAFTSTYPNIRSLNLSNNRFNGTLSCDLFENLEQLHAVDLSNNQFSGLIPPSLANFSGLELLD